MNNPSETSKPSMESGDGNTGKKWWNAAHIFSGGIDWILKAKFLYQFTGIKKKKKRKLCTPTVFRDLGTFLSCH